MSAKLVLRQRLIQALVLSNIECILSKVGIQLIQVNFCAAVTSRTGTDSLVQFRIGGRFCEHVLLHQSVEELPRDAEVRRLKRNVNSNSSRFPG